jgi:ubiquinone/menaquinone biosynthesis C-methylase UbiE
VLKIIRTFAEETKREEVQTMSHDANKTYFETAGVAEAYAQSTSLFEAEEAVLASLREELRDKPILDIGVGAGRTTGYLRDISKNYVGIDYSEKMIKLCSERFADATLMVCDARDLSAFDDRQFAAVFYSYNGIDEVAPADRMLILKEVNRVLKEGGVFVFSSHNLDWEGMPFYLLSWFSFSPNPVRLIRDNMKRFMAYAAGVITHLRDKNGDRGFEVVFEFEKRTRMMLPTYYISKEAQVRQLLEAGFCRVEALDSHGQVIPGHKNFSDAWLNYMARKA